LTGALYKAKEDPLKMSTAELVTHMLFNTTRSSNHINNVNSGIGLPNTGSSHNLHNLNNNHNNNNNNHNNTLASPRMEVSLLWQGNWTMADYAENTLYDLNSIEIRFIFTTATVQCIPCMSFLLVRKSGANGQFVKFDVVSA
jgi:hypothetical protein